MQKMKGARVEPPPCTVPHPTSYLNASIPLIAYCERLQLPIARPLNSSQRTETLNAHL